MEDGEHIKEVYAHFGLAMYLAQVLEHGIVNALVCADLVPRRAGYVVSESQWANEVDSFMDGHFEKTLGTLIKTLRLHVAVPSTLETTLAAALRLRNSLAHDFFREHAEAFMSFRGREQMLVLLQDAQEKLRVADRDLDSVTEPYRIKIGYTEERLQKAFEEYRRACSD